METIISSTWVVGYGNFHRRDDGIGPYVAGRIGKKVKHKKDIRTLSLHQLDPDLIDELQSARMIIFVDATMDIIENGWKWERIFPEFKRFYHVTHLFSPSLILSLIHSLYQRNPETYIVSVQGDNFEFGHGLDPETQKRALKAASAIMEFLNAFHGKAEIVCNPISEGG